MKVHLPIVGKATGSSAGLIYQSYWGNTYTRSFPFSFHYPDTKKQQECQSKFFDLQRYWIPIYNQIKKNIMKQQRKNKNPFNSLTSAIYHILNPYKEKKNERLPKNFGLDPYNRVRPVITDLELNFKDSSWDLVFYMQRPYNELSIRIDHIYIILFNFDKQNMMYVEHMFMGDRNEINLENTLDWEENDVIYCYISLASRDWLGNFNLIE